MTNDEIKKQLADGCDYTKWLETNRIELAKLHSGRHADPCPRH